MKKRELKKLLKQALQQLAAGREAANDPAPAPAVEGPTVAEWLVTYRGIINERGYNPQTIKNRTTSINHIETTWGAMKLRGIRPFDIISKLKQWSAHTAVRILGELKDVYVEAIANNAAESSPAAHVKRPKTKGLRKRLTLETWQAMLELARQGRQRWVLAMPTNSLPQRSLATLCIGAGRVLGPQHPRPEAVVSERRQKRAARYHQGRRPRWLRRRPGWS